MKRIVVLLLGLSLIAESSEALLGPPPELDARDVHLGLEVGTGKRDVKLTGSAGPSRINPTVLTFSQTSLDLRLDYGISKTFSVYGLLGFEKGDLGTLTFPAGLGNLPMNGDLGFLAGIGGQAVFSPMSTAPDLLVALSGEFRTFRSDISGGQIDADEIRLALKGSRRFGQLVPYGGVMWSSLSADFTGTTSISQAARGDLDSDDEFGLLLGAQYDFSPRIQGRVEAELVSSTAINLSVVYNLGGSWTHPPRAAAPPPEPAGSKRTSAKKRGGSPAATRRRAERSERAYEARRRAQEVAAEGGREERRKESSGGEGEVRAPSGAVGPEEAAASPSPRDIAQARELVREGNELVELGKTADAIVKYRRAVALDPSNVRAWYNLATAQYLDRDYLGARASYEETVHLNPEDVDAHLYLGFCYFRLGDRDGAIREWKRVLELDPESSVAKNNIQALSR